MKKVQRSIVTAMLLIPSFAGATDVLTPGLFLGKDKDVSSKSPWFSTTLNKKTIKEANAQSIPELLRLIPGFVYSTPFGSYRSAFYRGMSDEYPRRTRVEIDGVPVNLASVGSVLWGALPFGVEDIESITFISNPSGALNGSQSFNGVLKIYTVKADRANNLASVTVGNKDLKRVYVRGASSIDDDSSIQVSASKLTSLGENVEVSSEDKAKVWVNYLKTIDNNTIVGNFGVGHSMDDEITSEAQPQIPAYADRETKNIQGNVSWTNTENGQLKVVAGVNFVENNTANLLSNGILFDISYDSTRTFLSTDYQNTFGDKGSYLVGFSHTKDVETPNTWSQSESRWESDNTAANLNIGYDLDVLKFSAGIGVEKHSDYSELEKNVYISALKELTPTSTISTIFSQGTRFPVNWESKSEHYVVMPSIPLTLIRNEVSVEDVSPEEVNSFSVKYEYSESYNKKFAARLYRDVYSNLIYSYFTAPSSGLGLYGGKVISNGAGDKMTVNGLELHGSWSINHLNSLLVSYSHNEVEGDTDNINSREDSIPDDILTVGWKTSVGGINFNTIFTHVSEAVWDSQDAADTKKVFKGYSTATVNASHCRPMSGGLNELCFSASASNVLAPVSTFYAEDAGSVSDTQWIFKADYSF